MNMKIDLSKLSKKDAAIVSAILLLVGAIANQYLGVNLQIGDLQSQINQNVASVITAMQKEASYIIGVSGSNYYMMNGTGDHAGRVEYVSANRTAVETYAVGNMTAGGTLYLKNVEWNVTITKPSSITVIQDYYGQITYIGQAKILGATPYTVRCEGTGLEVSLSDRAGTNQTGLTMRGTKSYDATTAGNLYTGAEAALPFCLNTVSGFGNIPTAFGGSSSAGTILTTRHLCTFNGTVTRISTYAKSTTGTGELIGAIYSDNNGLVGSLLSSGTATIITSTTGDYYNLTGLSVSVVAGTYYWLGVMFGVEASWQGSYTATAINNYTIGYQTGLTYPNVPASYTPTYSSVCRAAMAYDDTARQIVISTYAKMRVATPPSGETDVWTLVLEDATGMTKGLGFQIVVTSGAAISYNIAFRANNATYYVVAASKTWTLTDWHNYTIVWKNVGCQTLVDGVDVSPADLANLVINEKTLVTCEMTFAWTGVGTGTASELNTFYDIYAIADSLYPYRALV